jgi:hypothetical protein
MPSTRRDFLKQTAAATTAAIAGLGPLVAQAAVAPAQPPWYRRVQRWGQTNITEADAAHYDIAWWRRHWKRTCVGGVIINAGGIFAYYPSKVPLHYSPPQLAGRDLYGELARAAHDDGLAVIARMDSSKTHADLYHAHPDWFAVDASGRPYRSGEFYLTCISGPYYEQYIPDILREIIQRSSPQGIADNIWSGVERSTPCYCTHCARRFREYSGKDLPAAPDWNDPLWRQWNEWNYTRRTEQWDFNNRVTRSAGGDDCLWIGMNGAGIAGLGGQFRDMKDICSRAEIILLDNQSRTDAGGFSENAEAGAHVHGLLGWDKLVPESMAMYQHGRPQFRLSAKRAAEVRLWMLAGFAGGIQPWWHHVGAYGEDRRRYRTAEPIMRWHAANDRYLVNRRPLATVAVAWSRKNADYFGRDNTEELVAQPWRGMTQALVRGRIPYVPLHLDHLDRDGENFSVLVLPNVGAISDDQIAAIRRFVSRGGALVATGQSSLFSEFGDRRPDFALADLFGVSGAKPLVPPAQALHTYLRLTPELRGGVDGPMLGHEPLVALPRHAILAGFDETDILPFGGTLAPLTVDPAAKVLLTFIPPVPSQPPEIVWMRQPRTMIPGLVVNESHPGRVVYFSADIDRRLAQDNFPDHADLLAGAVRWAAGDRLPLKVDGPGLLNCQIYQQDQRLILHVVNLTNSGTWRAPVDELIPVGPLRISVRLPGGVQSPRISTLVSRAQPAAGLDSGWITFDLASVLDHEVIIIET